MVSWPPLLRRLVVTSISLVTLIMVWFLGASLWALHFLVEWSFPEMRPPTPLAATDAPPSPSGSPPNVLLSSPAHSPPILPEPAVGTAPELPAPTDRVAAMPSSGPGDAPAPVVNGFFPGERQRAASDRQARIARRVGDGGSRLASAALSDPDAGLAHDPLELGDSQVAADPAQPDLVTLYEQEGASPELIAHLRAEQELALKAAELLGEADAANPEAAPQ